MAYALVGTIGTVVTPSSGAAANPAWGASETQAAGNLLVCWVSGGGSTTLPPTPSGWSVAAQVAGTNCSATVFYLIAAGSDPAPTIAATTSTVWRARLAEFSGGASASPLDQSGTATGTTGTTVATAGAADTAVGELVVAASVARYSASATKTLSNVLNNATLTDTQDGGTAATNHYGFAYDNTTANASADANTWSYTATSVTGAATVVATFKLAGSTAYTQPLAGGLTPAGTIAKQTARALAGGLTPVGTIAKKTARALAGGLTPTGALSTFKSGGSHAYTQALSASVSFTGSVTKGTSRAFSGALSFIGNLAGALGHLVTGSPAYCALTDAPVYAAALTDAAVYSVQQADQPVYQVILTDA